MPQIVGTLKPPRLGTAPSSPVGGQIYFDTAANILKYWNNTAWITEGLPADTVVVAGTRILANKLLAADAQPAWRVLGDGKQEWGPGGAIGPDINFFRSRQYELTIGNPAVPTASRHQFAIDPDWAYWTMRGATDGIGFAFRFATPGVHDVDMFAQAGFDGMIFYSNFTTQNYARLGTDGLFFGQSFDTRLYRWTTNQLKTDGGLIALGTDAIAGGRFAVTNGVYINGLVLTDNTDYWLWTVGNWGVGLNTNLAANLGGAGQIFLTGSSGVASILFGNLQDANLYRTAANSLRTSGSINIGGALVLENELYRSNAKFFIDTGGTLQWGVGDWGRDTNWYRVAAGILRTDGSISILGTYSAYPSGVGNFLVTALASDTQMRLIVDTNGKIQWGPGGTTALDTFVSRTAENELSMGAGDTFKVSDAGLKFNDNSVQTTAAGAGGLAKLAEVTLASDAANIDITGIPTTGYLSLLVVGYMQTNQGVGGDRRVNIRFNGDTAGNYSDDNGSGRGEIQAGWLHQGLRPGWGSFRMLIPNYVNGAAKPALCSVTGTTDNSGNKIVQSDLSGCWNSSSAINRITLFPDGGTFFRAGSKVTVYGMV